MPAVELVTFEVEVVGSSEISVMGLDGDGVVFAAAKVVAVVVASEVADKWNDAGIGSVECNDVYEDESSNP